LDFRGLFLRGRERRGEYIGDAYGGDGREVRKEKGGLLLKRTGWEGEEKGK